MGTHHDQGNMRYRPKTQKGLKELNANLLYDNVNGK